VTTVMGFASPLTVDGRVPVLSFAVKYRETYPLAAPGCVVSRWGVDVHALTVEVGLGERVRTWGTRACPLSRDVRFR
jgi:hypothetical protein